MRMKPILPFDPNKEYQPGDKCSYRGKILILKKYPRKYIRIAKEDARFLRCVLCRIDICTAINANCDKYRRKDKTNVYWDFVRLDKTKNNENKISSY